RWVVFERRRPAGCDGVRVAARIAVQLTLATKSPLATLKKCGPERLRPPQSIRKPGAVLDLALADRDSRSARPTAARAGDAAPGALRSRRRHRGRGVPLPLH